MRRLAFSVVLLSSLSVASAIPSVAQDTDTSPAPPAATAGGSDAREGDADAGLVVVMDASGSMRDDAGDGTSRIEVAREAVGVLVDEIPDGLATGLRLYGHRVGNTGPEREEGCRDTELVVPVAPLDRDAMRAAVAEVEPSGYTPIGTSLLAAAGDLADVEGKRSVVLVSDGIDTCAPPDACDVAADLAAREVELSVQVVGFQVDADAAAQLRCIADATGGEYVDAEDGSQLAGALVELSLAALRVFEPTGIPIDGTPDLEEAPQLNVGQWTDLVQLDTPVYYRLDQMPGEQLRISVARPEIPDLAAEISGTTNLVAYHGGRDVRDGAFLDCERANQGGKAVEVLVASLATQVFDAGDEQGRCRGEGPGWLQVHLEGTPDATRSPGDDPIEIPLEIQVLSVRRASEGPPSTPTGVAAGAGAVRGTASFAAAPLVGEGSYTDVIREDEVLYWAVDVAEGQQLEVTASVVDPVTSTWLDVSVLDPARNDNPSTGRLYEPARGTSDDQRTLVIPRVGQGEDYQIPGRHLVRVEIHQGGIAEQLRLDIRLAGEPSPATLSVTADPGRRPPHTYEPPPDPDATDDATEAEPATAPDGPADDEPVAAATADAAESEGGGGVPLPAVLALLLAGVAAAFVMGRRGTPVTAFGRVSADGAPRPALPPSSDSASAAGGRPAPPSAPWAPSPEVPPPPSSSPTAEG